MCDPVASYHLEHSTPVFDVIVDYLLDQGLRRATALSCGLTFGIIWRYNQKRDRACYATQQRLADDIKTCVRSFQRHLARLIELDLVIDEHPGRRNATHVYRLSETAERLLSSPTPPLYDNLSYESLYDSESHDVVAVVVKDESKKIDDSLYNLFSAGFGEMNPGQVAVFKKWRDDPAIPEEWLTAAIEQTIAAEPAKPFAYLRATLAGIIASGGPSVATRSDMAESTEEKRPARRNGQQQAEAQADDLPYLAEAQAAAQARLGGTVATAGQRKALTGLVVEEIRSAVDDGRLLNWQNALGWDEEMIVGTFASHVESAYLAKNKMMTGYGESRPR